MVLLLVQAKFVPGHCRVHHHGDGTARGELCIWTEAPGLDGLWWIDSVLRTLLWGARAGSGRDLF